MKNGNKPSFLKKLAGGSAQANDAARLEAFVSAFPGEYCGWSERGEVIASPGLTKLLGAESIRSLADIQSRLGPGDAAALEGLMDRLRRSGARFSINTHTHDGAKSLRISGARGAGPSNKHVFNVLWIETAEGAAPAQGVPPASAMHAHESELVKSRAAMNAIPRPLWLRDQDQKIIWCNTTYADFLNTTVETVLKDQKEIAAQALKKKTASRDELAPGKTLAAAALKAGKTLETTAHAVVKGARILMRISEIPLAPLQVTLGIAFNITREEELETNMKRYQSSTKELLEHLRSAIAIYGADEKLEFYNSAFSQLWGLEDQWLNTGPKLGDIMEKLRQTRRLPEQADFKRFKQSWISMFTGLIGPYEDMLHLPDGSTVRLLVVPHSLGGLMMTFEDVTSRLQLESSYNILIAVQKETLDNLAEAVAVFGGDGRLKLSNPAYGRLWGLHPEDLEGEPHITKIVDKMRHCFQNDEWPTRREELIASGLDRLMHEGRLTRGDGALVDFVTVPLPDGGVLITYTDVTDKMRVENALREKNAALEAAEQLKLDFLANVSYQLRTPLNAIMGFNEILEQQYFGPLNDRQREYTRDIKEASERLLGLINDILDLSTLEAGYMKLTRAELKVGPMLQSVFDLVQGWARKEDINITFDCPADTGTVIGDERRLQQAVINLVRNAIAFTPAGGQIVLGAARRKDGIAIFVKDTGFGIAKEDRMRIFEPFQRAGGGRRKSSRTGPGLGLPLVRSIVALHGGTVDLESEQGKGTIVTLILPSASVKTSLKIPAIAGD
ncbi:MAG: PAS-domain containing protein [Alphaproteobacteria bacterium]